MRRGMRRNARNSAPGADLQGMGRRGPHRFRGRFSHRLYLQIYLTVVASLVLVVIAAAAIWRVAQGDFAVEASAMAGEVAAAALPAIDAPEDRQQEALARLATRLKADLALFDASRAPIASALVTGGEALAAPGEREHGFWRRGWNVQLPDGRWLVMRLEREHRPPRFAWLGFLALIALAVAFAAYPVVRRLTRRLERLQASVEALGSGDLSARVKVHGHDEIASLAASFNRAAERIEALVDSHRMLLANTSHELRTPLARIRMGIELMSNGADAKRKAELERDIAELDAMIDDLLTLSRLDGAEGPLATEDVDLLALAAEEAARYDDVAVSGEPVIVRGDPALLRRLVRNLLENAYKHGAPPVEVNVRREGEAVELSVRDHGPGIAEETREKVFDAFFRLPGSAQAGTGLGLALVRRIARRHGGDALCAAPSEGAGVEFIVRVP